MTETVETTDKVETIVPPAADPVEDAQDAAMEAHDEIKNHVIAAMAMGLMPIPGVDMAGMLGIQVRMVSRICKIYGETLRENAARAAVLSLAGGVLPATLATGFVSGLKFIPGFGTLPGAAGASLLGGAMTYAIGRVFQEHLETHESLIDFDPTKANSTMRREFDNGVNFARSLRAKVTSKIIAKAQPDVAPAEAAEPGHAAPAMETASA